MENSQLNNKLEAKRVDIAANLRAYIEAKESRGGVVSAEIKNLLKFGKLSSEKNDERDEFFADFDEASEDVFSDPLSREGDLFICGWNNSRTLLIGGKQDV